MVNDETSAGGTAFLHVRTSAPNGPMPHLAALAERNEV